MTFLTHLLSANGNGVCHSWSRASAAASSPLHRFAEIVLDIGSIPRAWWLITAYGHRRGER